MCDILEEVCSHIQLASYWIKEYYDIRAQQGGYREGDLLWLIVEGVPGHTEINLITRMQEQNFQSVI